MSDKPAGGVEARPGDEAQVERGGAARVAAGHREQRRHARLRTSGAQARQTLRDEGAVGLVEPHDVGDGAQRDEVEEAGEVGFGAAVESAPLPHPCARGDQYVEHHADAGDVLARERAAGLVGVDDDGRRRQRRTGQVVVGDEHVDAPRVRRRHAVDAGDAVVDRDEQASGCAAPRGRRSPASGRSRTRTGWARGSRRRPRAPAARARRPRTPSRRRHRSRRRSGCVRAARSRRPAARRPRRCPAALRTAATRAARDRVPRSRGCRAPRTRGPAPAAAPPRRAPRPRGAGGRRTMRDRHRRRRP